VAYLAGIVNTTGTTSANLTYPTDLYPGDRVIVVASGSNTQTMAYSDGISTYSSLATVTTTPFLYTHSASITTFVPRGTTLSITWGGVTRNPAITLSIFRPDNGETLGTPIATTANSAGGSVTTLSLTSATPAAAAGRIFLGTVSLGSSTATVTGDADSLGVAWSTRTTYTNATSNRTVAQQIKITSNPSAQTFNPTFTSTTAAGSLVVIPIDVRVAATSLSDGKVTSGVLFSPNILGVSDSNAQLNNFMQFDVTNENAESASAGRFNPTLAMPITGESGNGIAGFSYSSSDAAILSNHRILESASGKSNANIESVVSNYDLAQQNADSNSSANVSLGTVYDIEPLSAIGNNDAVFNPRVLVSPTDPPSVDLDTFGDSSGDITLSVAYSGRNQAGSSSRGSADITDVVYDLAPQNADATSYNNVRLGTVYDIQALSAIANNNTVFNPRVLVSPTDPPSVDLDTFGDSSGDIQTALVMSVRNSGTNRSTAAVSLELISSPALNGSGKSNANMFARSNISLIENAFANSSNIFREPALRSPQVLYSSGRRSSGNINVLGTEFGPFIGWGIPL